MFSTALSVAEVINLIDTLLFGAPCVRPARAPAVRRKKKPKPLPRAHPAPALPCPLDSMVLRKASAPRPVAVSAATPVTCAPARKPKWAVGLYTRPVTAHPLARPIPSSARFPAGFCYLAAFSATNQHRALVSLGSFPTATSVRNCPGFRADLSHCTVTRPGLYHLLPRARPGSVPLALCIGSWRVGAQPPPGGLNPAHFPNLPPRPNTLGLNLPGPRPNFPRPPITIPPGVRASNNAQAGPSGLNSGYARDTGYGPRGRGRGGGPPFNSAPRPAHPPVTGVHTGPPPGARRRAPSPAPYVAHPYPQKGRRSPPPPRVDYQFAGRDPYDNLIDELKRSLNDMPRPAANGIWQDFLVWLSDHMASRTFSRNDLDSVRNQFSSIRTMATTSMQEEEERAAALQAAADNLAAAVSRLHCLQQLESAPEPLPDSFQSDLASAQQAVDDLQAVVNSVEDTDITPPSPTAPGEPQPLGDVAPAVPAPTTRHEPAPWTEANYENFYQRTSAAFPSINGKYALADLLEPMDTPLVSKLRIPRALELYSVDELKEATKRGVRPWLNRHEDPLEPFRCWSEDLFSRVYNAHAFCFLVARVAQRDAQFKDPKLEKLRSSLSARWGVEVTVERIQPRQDWMLFILPSVPSPESPTWEIMSTAIMRLADGNASYVVRHLAPRSTLRDLDVFIKGSLLDPNAVYNRLRKRQLEYESSGAHLGWRVIGVRSTNGVSKYRATFLLDSGKVYWPWAHQFNHPHASIPAPHNLLDFSPLWSATKPYACQCCYNSDHFTGECPLVHTIIGSVPVISPTSLSLMMHKRAAERLVVVDRSLVPRKAPPAPLGAEPEATGLTPVPEESPARPASPNTSAAIHLASDFLSLKLHSLIGALPGLSMRLIQDLCRLHSGDIHMVASNLHSRGYDFPWNQRQLEDEWISYRSSVVIPGTVSMSGLSVAAPTPPRYIKQVEFIGSLLPPGQPLSPPANIPEIVASCKGNLAEALRRLEVTHKADLGPWSSDSINERFSTFLMASWSNAPPFPFPAPPAPPLGPLPAPAHAAPPAASPAPRPASQVASPADASMPTRAYYYPLAYPLRPIPPLAPPAPEPPASLPAPPASQPAPTCKLPPSRITDLTTVHCPALASRDEIIELSDDAIVVDDAIPVDNTSTPGPTVPPSLMDAMAAYSTPAPPDAASLATAKRQFNDPGSQLKALFPAIPEEDISAALERSEGDIPGATQMLEYALSSPPPLPRPSQNLASPVISWPPSAPSPSDAPAMSILTNLFPDIHEELLWRAMRRANGDAAVASASLSAMQDALQVASALHSAFPAAPEDVISETLAHFSDVSSAFLHLSDMFISAWDPEATPGRMLAISLLAPAPDPAAAIPKDFVPSDQSMMASETTWWHSLIAAKKFKIASIPGCAALWNPISEVSTSNNVISPRFLAFITRLGSKERAPTDYADAVAALRALPSYLLTCQCLVRPGYSAAAKSILPALMEDGLITPGAAVWLAINSESDPALYDRIKFKFRVFPLKFREVWARRNTFLYALARSRAAAPASVDPTSAADAPATSALSSPLTVRSAARALTRERSSSVAPYEIQDPGRTVQAPKSTRPTKRKRAPPVGSKSAQVAASVAKSLAAASRSKRAGKTRAIDNPLLPEVPDTPNPPARPVRATRSNPATRAAINAALAAVAPKKTPQDSRSRSEFLLDAFYESESRFRPLGPYVPPGDVTSRRWIPFVDMPPAPPAP